MPASHLKLAWFLDLFLLTLLSAPVASAAPRVTVTSPSDGVTTTSETIQVVARVDDATPGRVRVTCNGRAVPVHDGAVRCAIPLDVGVNAVEVRAINAIGEGTSAVFRVSRKTRAGLTLIPNAVAVTQDRQQIIAAVTSSGHEVDGVGWRIADDRVVALEPFRGAATLAGRTVGHTTISARANGQIADAAVTVVAPASFLGESPPGTRNWAVGPMPGLRQRAPLRAVRIVQSPPADADVVVAVEGCDLFAVDADPAGRFAVVRGLTNRGNLVWLGRIPGTPLGGDVLGGLLALIGPIGKPSRVLGRFDRADASAGIWRFYADGTIDDVTQSGDGTIYLVERLTPAPRITVLDGRSGAVKARLSPEVGAMLGPLVGLDDDSALMQLRDTRGVSLAHITPTGIDVIAHLSSAGAQPSDIAPGPAIRTGRGDTVAFWSDRNGLHLSLVSESSVTAQFTMASHVRQRRTMWQVLIDAFDSPWVYVSDGVSLEAIDLERSQKRWELHTTALPFEAVDDRHVVASDPATHRVIEIDDRGNIVLTMNATVKDAMIVVMGNGVLYGFDPATRSIVEVSEPSYRESGWFSAFSFTTH